MSQPESRVVRKIREYIHARGGFTFKVHGSPFMMAGLPDVVCCYKGKFIGLEVKMPGNLATPQQKNVGEKIKNAKGHWLVVYGVESVETLLNYIDGITDGK